jgi:hypothetical protein
MATSPSASQGLHFNRSAAIQAALPDFSLVRHGSSVPQDEVMRKLGAAGQLAVVRSAIS